MAITIIYWLFQSGKIDFSLITKSFKFKTAWALSFSLVLGTIFLSTLRWKLLLEIKAKRKIAFISILKVQWIGLLFSSILPGAVTGDVIKLLYAKDLDDKFSKTFLLTSVLMDRVIGLLGLISLLGFSSILFYSELAQKPAVKELIHFNFILFLFIICFILGIFLPTKTQDQILKKTDQIPILGKQITKTLMQFWLLGSNKKLIFATIFISMIAQTFNIFAFWNLASNFFDHPVPIKYAFTFIPVGLISVAIPITPSGLGVGHMVFDKLFSFFNISKGASLFNFFFILSVSSYLLGIFPYLFSSKIHKLDEN